MRRPAGRPSFLPSDLILVSASFVRCEIRLRSISAERAKAKASTFEFMLSLKWKFSFIAIMFVRFSIDEFNIAIIPIKLRLSLDISEIINVSPLFIFFSRFPSLRSSTFFVPLMVSSIHLSIVIFLSLAYFVISYFWVLVDCLSQLTLM